MAKKEHYMHKEFYLTRIYYSYKDIDNYIASLLTSELRSTGSQSCVDCPLLMQVCVSVISKDLIFPILMCVCVCVCVCVIACMLQCIIVHMYNVYVSMYRTHTNFQEMKILLSQKLTNFSP